MFWKMIFNHLVYSKSLINFFESSNSSLDIQYIEEASERMLYLRAYQFIKKIDIKDPYHQKILQEENLKNMQKAYQMSIEFFENEEEYEKCAFLKKQLDFISFSS